MRFPVLTAYLTPPKDVTMFLSDTNRSTVVHTQIHTGTKFDQNHRQCRVPDLRQWIRHCSRCFTATTTTSATRIGGQLEIGTKMRTPFLSIIFWVREQNSEERERKRGGASSSSSTSILCNFLTATFADLPTVCEWPLFLILRYPLIDPLR